MALGQLNISIPLIQETLGVPSEIQGSNLYAAMKVTNVTSIPSDITFTVTPSIASQYTY